jgi:hypothetical protein
MIDELVSRKRLNTYNRTHTPSSGVAEGVGVGVRVAEGVPEEIMPG